MSDGSSAAVAIKQSTVPDRSIDCDLMPDGTYRQRVDAVRVSELLENVVALLNLLVQRTPDLDPLTRKPQAPATVGGLRSVYAQMHQINSGAMALRAGIVVI
jgi:hypothetical protein